jgi:hypothetical protein
MPSCTESSAQEWNKNKKQATVSSLLVVVGRARLLTESRCLLGKLLLVADGARSDNTHRSRVFVHGSSNAGRYTKNGKSKKENASSSSS